MGNLNGDTIPLQQPEPKEQLLEALSNPNNLIGNYVLLEKIGTGGIADVYKAWQVNLKRYVAIKKLHEQSQDEAKRLLREAQIAAKLQHANIVQVYDMLTIKDQSYIVMQYIDGKSLAELKLPRKDILKIMQKIGEAVEYAHEYGIVHRDIKPGNIMVDKAWQCYLTDFGLARQVMVDSSISRSGYAIGTPWFMSPEQAMGRSKDVDYQSDVFSLGSTLYKLVTGEVPFDSPEVYGVLKSIVDDEPPSPRSLDKSIDRDLETIILKALEKDKTRRYQGTKELADDIGRYLRGEPVVAQRTGPVAKLLRKVKRNKSAAIAILVVLLIIIAAGLNELRKETERSAQFSLLKQMADESYERSDWVNALKQYKGAEGIKSTKEIQAKIDECTAKIKDIQTRKEVIEKLQTYIILTEKIKRYFYNEKLDMKEAWDLIDKAHAELDELKKVHSGVSQLYYIKGLLYSYQLEVDLALEQFEKAIELDKDNYHAIFELTSLSCWVFAEYGMGRGMFYPIYPSKTFMDKMKNNINQARKLMSGVTAKEVEILTLKIDLIYKFLFEPGHVNIENECIKYFAEYHDEDFYFIAGLSSVMNLKLEKGIEYFTKVIDARPRHLPAYLNRGVTHSHMGHHDAAINDFNKILDLKADNVHALNARAIFYSEKGDYDRALDDLNKSIKLKPHYSLIYSNRGLLYVKKGDYDRAIEDYTRSLELEPSADTYYNRARAYSYKGEYDKELEDYNQAIKLDPEFPDPYVERSLIYWRKGDIARTITDLEKAIEVAPKGWPRYQEVERFLNQLKSEQY